MEEAQEEGSRPASMHRVCDDVTHTEGYGAFPRWRLVECLSVGRACPRADPEPQVPCIAPGTLSCYGKVLHVFWDRCVQGESAPGGSAMEVAIHLPDDVAAAVPWEDVPRHLVEQIALEGYQDGWLSEEQVRRLLGYETRLEVHGFLKDHDVPLRYTLEHLEQDREAHRQLGF